MFRAWQIPWSSLIAAAVVAAFVAVAFSASDWSHARVQSLIVHPMDEALRLAW
jgi:hypothetical protein